MSLTTQSAKRRTSFIELESNPFEANNSDEITTPSHQIENLTDTVKIEKEDLNNILNLLEGLRLKDFLFLDLSSIFFYYFIVIIIQELKCYIVKKLLIYFPPRIC